MVWIVLYALLHKKKIYILETNKILRFTPGTRGLKNCKNPL